MRGGAGAGDGIPLQREGGVLTRDTEPVWLPHNFLFTACVGFALAHDEKALSRFRGLGRLFCALASKFLLNLLFKHTQCVHFAALAVFEVAVFDCRGAEPVKWYPLGVTVETSWGKFEHPSLITQAVFPCLSAFAL